MQLLHGGTLDKDLGTQWGRWLHVWPALKFAKKLRQRSAERLSEQVVTGCELALEMDLVTDLCARAILSLEAVYNLMKFDWRDGSPAIFVK